MMTALTSQQIEDIHEALHRMQANRRAYGYARAHPRLTALLLRLVRIFAFEK